MHSSQTVSDAVTSRRSVRGFLNTPVDVSLVKAILEKAARAPSGGNLQPWHLYLVGGDALAGFKQRMAQRVQEAPTGEPMEYAIYPKPLVEPYQSRRFEVGEDLYGALGIARDNKFGRLMWFSRNFQFFGAPLALFCYVNRSMGPPQWSDLGMYLQTVMLLLREAGLDSCAQECWAVYPQTVAELVKPPADQMLFCGMSIGFKDEADPANSFTASRAPLEAYLTSIGV